jgi:GT2 family glycosyltransferase
MPDWWEGIERTFERFENALVASPMSPKEPGWGYGEDGYRIHCPYEEAFSMETVRKLIESKGGAVIDAIPMWCAVFKRELFLEEVGLFDEMFFPGGGEDYDMDARVYQAGYRALASSYSWVWHHWGQSKDEKSGFDVSLPNARDHWNKLSTKGFGEDGLWEPDCDVWGNDCERTRGVFRAEL